MSPRGNKVEITFASESEHQRKVRPALVVSVLGLTLFAVLAVPGALKLKDYLFDEDGYHTFGFHIDRSTGSNSIETTDSSPQFDSGPGIPSHESSSMNVDDAMGVFDATVTTFTVPQEQIADIIDSSSPGYEYLASLATLGRDGEPISQEEAEELIASLRKLSERGAESVPAIRKFLREGTNVNFRSIPGGNLIGYSTLREAVIDALGQINESSALLLSLETLRSTVDPQELALLAHSIEEQAPGQYRQQLLGAAQTVLSLATSGQIDATDVGPLFDVFRSYGDINIVGGLENTVDQWTYYSIMAMAGLPSGEGIPGLIRVVEDPVMSSSVAGNFARQMLAQISAQYPEARDVLLEQARANQIPDSAWPMIGTALSGDSYEFGVEYTINSEPSNTPGWKGFHVEAGNQNFFSTPVQGELSEKEVAAKQSLIEELLKVTSNSVAVESLLQARASLPSPKSQQ